MKTEAMPASTEFKFNCPTCGQHILVATQWSGLGITCPSCQTRVTIPAPPKDERSTQPDMSPKHPGQTIRIELPIKASQGTPGVNSLATKSKPASVAMSAAVRIQNPPTILGNDPWPDLVRKLEKGELAEPAVLATALFRELTNVRRRLDEVERKLAPDRPSENPPPAQLAKKPEDTGEVRR